MVILLSKNMSILYNDIFNYLLNNNTNIEIKNDNLDVLFLRLLKLLLQ